MSKSFKQTKVHIFTIIIDIKGILFLDQLFNNEKHLYLLC